MLSFKPAFSLPSFTNIHSQLKIARDPRILIRERIVSSINGTGTIGYPYEKEVNSDTDLTIHTIINSEWMIDLNAK